MPGIIWKEIYTEHQHNSIIAAGATEGILSTKSLMNEFGPFNRLMVHNRDAVDIQILLDGLTEAGKLFELAAGETLMIEPEDGITFRFLTQKNLDGVVAEVADEILFRWAKCVREEKLRPVE